MEEDIPDQGGVAGAVDNVGGDAEILCPKPNEKTSVGTIAKEQLERSTEPVCPEKDRARTGLRCDCTFVS